MSTMARIIVTIRGGVLEEIEMYGQDVVDVIVIDHDIEGLPKEELTELPGHARAVISRWPTHEIPEADPHLVGFLSELHPVED